MTAQTQLGSTFNMQQLPFFATDIPNANGTFRVTADVNEYVALYDGSIIGGGVLLNDVLTGGTLTLRATINGTACPAFETTLEVGQQTATARQDARRAGFAFRAGDRLGLTWVKAGTVAPTTRDATAALIVLYENVRY
jgi:hypothetical protein